MTDFSYYPHINNIVRPEWLKFIDHLLWLGRKNIHREYGDPLYTQITREELEKLACLMLLDLPPHDRYDVMFTCDSEAKLPEKICNYMYNQTEATKNSAMAFITNKIVEYYIPEISRIMEDAVDFRQSQLNKEERYDEDERFCETSRTNGIEHDKQIVY